MVGEYTIKEGLNIPLLAAENFYYLKNKDSTETPKLKINSKDLSKTSFNRGQNILTAEVFYNNKSIGSLNLASGADYAYKAPALALKNSVNSINSMKILAYPVILILLISLLRIRKKVKQKKRDRYW